MKKLSLCSLLGCCLFLLLGWSACRSRHNVADGRHYYEKFSQTVQLRSVDIPLNEDSVLLRYPFRVRVNREKTRRRVPSYSTIITIPAFITCLLILIFVTCAPSASVDRDRKKPFRAMISVGTIHLFGQSMPIAVSGRCSVRRGGVWSWFGRLT